MYYYGTAIKEISNRKDMQKREYNLPYFREIMTGHKNQVIDFLGRRKFEFMK